MPTQENFHTLNLFSVKSSKFMEKSTILIVNHLLLTVYQATADHKHCGVSELIPDGKPRALLTSFLV